MKLDLRSVLWRTRGQHWDYTFVLRPISPSCDSWFEVHKKAFANLTPDDSPVTCGGIFNCGSKKLPFVATTFLDWHRRDAVGRRVAHYIICFPCADANGIQGLNVPGNWGLQVISSFDDIFSKMFCLPSSDVQNQGSEIIETSFSTAREKVNNLFLSGDPITVALDTEIEVSKPHGKMINTNCGSAPRPIHNANRDVAKCIESAVIEGEAFALGFKGNFGTVKTLFSKIQPDDLLQKLADSFGGSYKDQFIRNRLEGIKGRVAQATLPINPRRGFDLIIEALQTHPFDVAAKLEDHESTIAGILGASIDDQIVKNVVARLKDLALLR